jgi:hypothetical protein
MHVVALQFDKDAGDALAVRLAAVLGRTLLEARGRVSEPEGGPAVLATFGAPGPAEEYAEELRSRGFEVLVLPPEEVERDGQRLVVRSFELGSGALTVQSRQGKTVVVPWPEVRLLLRGIVRMQHKRTVMVQQRELSLGRAILTHGLVVTKVKKSPRTEVVPGENEGFLHLYAPSAPPLVFPQNDLDYSGLVGLGPGLEPSAAANFARLGAALRAACPEARYDERLATQQGQARLLGPSLPPERHLDVAVTLLSRALLAPRARDPRFG